MSKFQKQLHKLPKQIQYRVYVLLPEIQQGTPIRSLNCKYIEKTKNGQRFLSYPLGMSYRLLLVKNGNRLEPEWVGSHSQYNHILKYL